jgi:hypothetical protein
MKKFIWPIVFTCFVLLFFSWIIRDRHMHRFREVRSASRVAQFVEALERNWYDLKMRQIPKEQAQRVMIAMVDDASLTKYGRWPWSRAVYKEILNELYALGAETVAFDVVFFGTRVFRR